MTSCTSEGFFCDQLTLLSSFDPSLCQIYPDEGHFLSRQSRHHLFTALTSFFRECLKEELLPLPDDEEEEEE